MLICITSYGARIASKWAFDLSHEDENAEICMNAETNLAQVSDLLTGFNSVWGSDNQALAVFPFSMSLVETGTVSEPLTMMSVTLSMTCER